MVFHLQREEDRQDVYSPFKAHSHLVKTRYLAPDFVRYNPQDSHVRSVRYDPCGFFFRVMHPNIAFLCRTVYQGFFALFIDLLRYYALCIFGESSYKHLLVRRRNARSSGDEETNPKHQNLYEVAGALCFFCTNATSGITRRRRLMCAR